MAAWADVCTYENICYDGTTVYFPVATGGCRDNFQSCQHFNEFADLKEGLIYPAWFSLLKDPDQIEFPFNGGASLLALADSMLVK